MIVASNTTNSLQKRKQSYRSLIFWAAVFFVLLLLRDTYSVGINKYIFLGIACVCALYMKTKDLIYLYCFLFPVYVGLPGNFMTLVLLLRFLCETRRFKTTSLMLTLLLSAFMIFQNFTTGKTAITQMMYIPGLLVVLMLFTHRQKLDTTPMVLMYSAGVATLGFIMLASTLRVHSLVDLMSNAFRLGTSNAAYTEENIMRVSVDPNFFGTFAISAISLAFPLFLHDNTSKITKGCLAIFAFVQLVVALTGLSRTFILVLLLWITISLLTMRNTKSTVFAVVTISLFFILLVVYMSDVLETAVGRFDDADISTANGRTTIVNRYWNTWRGNIYYMFFGVGLFRCNVHCVPLQMLFGGGLIYFILMLALFLSYRPAKTAQRSIMGKLPFFATFIMMCSVPAAPLLNCMFPLVIVGLCMQDNKRALC